MWMLSLLAITASVVVSSKPLKTLQEVEKEIEDGKYPRTFPRGVLNHGWSNDRKLLKKLRRSLNHGQPFVIHDFLFDPVAEALLGQLKQLSERQDDQDEQGYPFQRLTEGPFQPAPREWTPLRSSPCERVVTDFQQERQHRFAFTGHILIGRKGDKHNAWYSAFRAAMQHPAVVHFWQSLLGIPTWVTAYDPSWSWLRPGDYYGLHADDAQVRYLAVTIHLASSWSEDQGGQLVWCGPDSHEPLNIEVPERPHFHKTFNVSKNGHSMTPGYNVAVIFPVYRNSYHAVAPVNSGEGKRFTLQGWYVDPCQFSENKGSCMPQAMARFKAWSEAMTEKSFPKASTRSELWPPKGWWFLWIYPGTKTGIMSPKVRVQETCRQ